MATLLIGSKNYSSWSLRPWLFLRKARFEFQEQIIFFDANGYQGQIAALSPSRHVPLLIDDGVKIWDSIAICEYAAETTGHGLPSDRIARARARSVAAEMHSGFQTLRNQCPMNVRTMNRRVPLTPELQADVERIDQIWSECRRDFGAGGNWLFGDFSIADAMFAFAVPEPETWALLVAGLALHGWLGAAALCVVAAFVGWLGYLSWPVLTTRGRIGRVAAFACALGLAAFQATR